MRKFIAIALVAGSLTARAQELAEATEATGAPAVELTKESYDKLMSDASYAHGYEIGFSMANYIKVTECDDEHLFQGLMDGLAEKSRFPEAESQAINKKYQEKLAELRKTDDSSKLDPDLKESGSYVTGLSICNFYILRDNFRNEIQADRLQEGLRRGLNTGRNIAKGMEARQTAIRAFDGAKNMFRLEAAEKNLKAGAAFLEANGKKDGVTTTDSGLQYKVLKSSTDAAALSPTTENAVKVHYTGKLVDGTEFDSSISRGEPAEFPLNGNIQGWIEALPKMKVGDKWRLFIPAELGYGDKAQPPKIGPNSALIFDVELLDVMAMPAMAPAPQQ